MPQSFGLRGNTTTIKFGRYDKLLFSIIKDRQNSLLKRRGGEIFLKFFAIDRNGGLRGGSNAHPSYRGFPPAYRFYVSFLLFSHFKLLFSNSSSSGRVIYFSEAYHRQLGEALLGAPWS